ncbi:hypothetical protein WICPIJ_001834 [Wickerhamomyces pijperi]|uniref:Amino acid permease/ SLC12A domain-containing protein n=1 Tax=Wickerhamomyces pijperi TaxID=599730 RepID=A0A9P8QCU0_WICPI|nr:hypothetical protein WICPIJ_001834 [Wickerhamomyces pijperi]
MPSEISAAAVIVSYWTDISQAVWISIIIVLIIASNAFSIRVYGEIEFVSAIIKMSLIVNVHYCFLFDFDYFLQKPQDC